MIESCSAHSPLLDENYVSFGDGSVAIQESDPGGSGVARFSVSGPRVVLRACDGGHQIRWLKEQKCADGAFIDVQGRRIRIHIVELKGRLSAKSWQDITRQFSGMFLNVLSLFHLLQLKRKPKVFCYIAYSNDKLSGSLAANTSATPVLLKTLVGGGIPVRRQEWDGDYVDLPFGVKAVLVKGRRDSRGDVDFGEV